MTNILYRVLFSFSKLVPLTKRKKFTSLIKHSGKNHNVNLVLGLMLFLIIIVLILGLSFILTFPFTEKYIPISEIEDFVPSFGVFVDGELQSGVVDGLSINHKKLISLGILVSICFIIFFLFYAFYYYLSERRSNFVDKILPDVLSLISSNINSGLTPYHAVKGAIRDDFGPLAEAFQIATNKSIGNKAFHESIKEIPDDFNSDSLTRSMNLFAAAIESGSNMTVLLKNLAKDIRERQSLRNELVTSTKTNSMFILFMVIVGAPILMSISIFFVDIVTGILSGTALGDTSDMGMSMSGEIAITVSFLKNYSIVFFFITGIVVAYFSGVVVEGNGKSGLKKAPLIVVASILIFLISLYLVTNTLGGLV